MKLPEKIQRERKKMRLSQEKLAEKMGVSRQAITKTTPPPPAPPAPLRIPRPAALSAAPWPCRRPWPASPTRRPAPACGRPTAPRWQAAPGAPPRCGGRGPRSPPPPAWLKGAAASALYGSEAANGVILITTKSGKTGQIVVNGSASVQIDNSVRIDVYKRQEQHEAHV